MSARGKKSRPAKKGGTFGRILLVLVLLVMLAAAGISFTERRDWPESLRNHDAVIAVYHTRDNMIEAVWSGKARKEPLPAKAKTEAKAPINLRPAAPKPEQGYSAKDRAKLEALIEKQGDLP
ncbi:MAG: hypothetical protein ACK4PK_09575 [Alphaproteobacteria bacterium]